MQSGFGLHRTACTSQRLGQIEGRAFAVPPFWRWRACPGMHALETDTFREHALGTDTFRQRSNFDWPRTQSWAQVNDTLQCDFQRGVFFQHKLAGGFARRKRRPHPSFVPPRAYEFARVVYRSSTMQSRCGFIFRYESSRPIPTPDDRLIPRQTSPQPRPEAPLRMCRFSPCSQALLSIRDSLHPQP